MTDAFAGETIPVSVAQRFDEAQLGEYLLEKANITLVSVKQMSGGQSNPTFLLITDDGEFVLRKQPPGNLLPSAHAVDREYRVLSALAGTDLPLPKVLLFCDDRSVIGTPFYVMERLRGRIFSAPLLDDVPFDHRRRIYFAMAEALAGLHRVDWKSVGLEGFGRTENYFRRHVARWTDQWVKSKTHENPSIDRLVEWLPEHLPKDERASIFHGDFRLGNIMFHPTEPEVIGILDWELATLGPSEADAAHNCTAYLLPANNPNSIRGADLAARGIPGEDEYLDHYCAALGEDRRPTAFHRAFALFRLAVITEGILSRAKAGIASSPQALEVGARGVAIADQGWEIARNAG